MAWDKRAMKRRGVAVSSSVAWFYFPVNKDEDGRYEDGWCLNFNETIAFFCVPAFLCLKIFPKSVH
jgi:hypothetical protein